MNLLAERRITLLLLAALFLINVSCEEDLGLELPPDVQRTEVKVVEFTLPAENVYYDSLRTDNQGKLIVGEYANDTYGNVRSEGYVEIRYKSGSLTFEDIEFRVDTIDFEIRNPSFQAAKLIVDVNGVLVEGLSMSERTVQVHALQDSVYSNILYLADRELPKGDMLGMGSIAFANLNLVQFDNDTLFYPFEVDISDTFGEEVFDGFADEITGYRAPGLAISADGADALFDLDLSSDTTEFLLEVKAEVFNKESNQFLRDTLLTTAFELRSANSFTHIERDRSGSIFAGVNDKEVTDPDPSHVYINQLAGIHPKIDFSPFMEFAETESGIIVNRANIEIETEEQVSSIPVIESLSGYFGIEESSDFYVNWPAILSSPDFYGLVLQTDNQYVRGSSTIRREFFEYDTLSTDNLRVGYAASPSLFWQVIFDNVQDDLNNVPLEERNLIQQELDGKSQFILNNPGGISLGQNVIKKDGIKLKVYYTRLKQ